MSWINTTIKTVYKHSLDSKKQRQFGVIILGVLVLILGVSIYKEGWLFSTKQLVTGIGSIIMLIVILIIPKLLSPFLLLWLFIGNILGEISSFIILGIVYYLMLCPITLIQRMMGKKTSPKGWIDKKEIIDYEKLY